MKVLAFVKTKNLKLLNLFNKLPFIIFFYPQKVSM